ncbi:MAG: right-handed parallel beta-helix repeat-containing protein, partial [Thermoguttaceae bacterium]|nr:right-handed parallel beta-helix repeat-containing protein [Thermoguttaceae bacterium]
VGVGVAITNNLFCDSPHHGMRTDGNDIYVARNEVHSVVYEYSDQSGIDIFCDPTFRGIVIEDNLWRHIGSPFALCGQAGIRLDDTISGVAMLRNIFYRASGGMFGGIQIHGGKDNLCHENLFVDCKQAFSFSPWGPGRYVEFAKTRFPQNLDNPAYLERYPLFDKLEETANRNYIFGNTAVNCGVFDRNGDANVFGANKYLANVPLETERYLTDPSALRAKLKELGAENIDQIGLLPSWKGVGGEVAPGYLNAK